MKVLYHSDAFASDSRYGLSRVAWELYEALLNAESNLELVPFSSRCKVNGEQLEKLISQQGFIQPLWKHRNLVLSWALAGYPKIEKWQSDANVIHTVEMDYPVATKKPWIVTVHDLGPLSHPEYFSKSRPWLRMSGIKSAIKRADKIMAVSTATADEIEVIAKHNLGDRLCVIPEGVSDYFFAKPTVDCLSELDDLPAEGTPFFLWTGSLNPRKNLGNVLAAYESIANEIPHSLVLAGGLGWDNHHLLDQISNSKFNNRIHRPGFVSDDQLRALYGNASAFVYVSLMEGFGLPILEAMACNCPVITSNLSSMPEVAGEASLLVSPTSAEEIGDAMSKIANSQEISQQLAELGFARAKGFTWEKCARSVIREYKSII
ncbi:MAG: hypothetical protein COA54_01240 [Thiotrichaceae bacterium]|nr:MAG: hypothetical protein COA54_01240 [Thiotrichaceae bacterium]